MEHPLSMLVAWAVFSLAVAFKIWRFSSLIRSQLRPAPTPIDQARQRLERLWQRDQQTA
jgi:hypothetical protein